MKKFVNLTAHPVNILLDGGDKIAFPASGTIARVGMDQVKVGDIDGIPVFRTVFSKNITDLPAPADDTVLSYPRWLLRQPLAEMTWWFPQIS